MYFLKSNPQSEVSIESKTLPEETDELRTKRDIAYAGAFNPDAKPYYVSYSVTERNSNSEWSTKGLVTNPQAEEAIKSKTLPEETDELRAKRDIAYAGAFKPEANPYYVSSNVAKKSVSEWSTKGLASHYGYNVYDEEF